MADKYTNMNFEEEVIQSKVPVLVDFWADWCGPCRMLAPAIEELAGEAEGFKVGKVNVDEESELARKYRIFSVPTVMVFKDGEMVNKAVGALSVQEMRDLIADAG